MLESISTLVFQDRVDAVKSGDQADFLTAFGASVVSLEAGFRIPVSGLFTYRTFDDFGCVHFSL